VSTDREVTRVVRSWLEEGVTALPDRVLDPVLDQLPATPQRRAPWPARRFGVMNTTSRLAAVAGAVAVIAVAALIAFPRVSGPGQSQPSTAPSASPIASPFAAVPSASSSAAASSSPSGSLGQLPTGVIPVGTYVMTPFAGAHSKVKVCLEPPQPGCTEPAADNVRAESIRLTLTVPDGWTSPETGNVWLAGKDFTAPDGAGLFIGRGAWLLTDPCQNGKDPDIPVGPTVNAFATALAAHPILDTSAPINVSLGGYSGKYIDLHVPSDYSRCDVYRPWEPGLFAQGPSSEWHLWILDVDGIRVVIQSMDYAATSAQNRAELQAIVDSIRIQP
jgi:hypothetical protein